VKINTFSLLILIHRNRDNYEMDFGDIPPSRIFYAQISHFIDPGSVVASLLDLLEHHGDKTDVLNHFESLRENSEKVKYARRLLQQNHFILNDVMQNPKSDVMSNKLRKTGNQHYAAKEYFKALEMYNQSICFAEQQSENLSIGFANRSAVYFEWQMFDRCLENIGLAKEANYPARLMPKLEKRRIDCEERMNAKMSVDVETVVPQLSYPAHANNPFMANCIELKENSKSGLHLITKRNLKIGDIVLIEKPFEARLRYQYRYQRCTNCLVENEMTLMPCPDCTSAMYCSTQCLKIAHEKYHKYECPIIDIMAKLKMENALNAVRILLMMIHEFGGIEGLATVVREMTEDGSASNLARFYSATGIDIKGMYNFFHLLKDNNERRQNWELFQYAVMAGVLQDLFMENTKLKDLLANSRHEDMFMKLLLKYLCICLSNSQTWSMHERDDEKGTLLK
jgi:SET and MYND domain-containing protein 4